MVDRMKEGAKAAGVSRTGIGETGGPVSDPERLEKVRQLKAELANESMFEWALYWNARGSSGWDGRMDGETADVWFG